jgi:hypothetical protein
MLAMPSGYLWPPECATGGKESGRFSAAGSRETQGTQLVSSMPPSVPGRHLFEGHSEASRQACFSPDGQVVDVTHLMPKRGVPQQALPPQSAIPRQLICVKSCGQVFAQLGASAPNEAQHESPPLQVSPGPHGIETLLPLPVPPLAVPPEPAPLVPAEPPLAPPPDPSPLEQAPSVSSVSVSKKGLVTNEAYHAHRIATNSLSEARSIRSYS